MEETYVCTLTEDALKKARDELNEIPSDRLSAVQAFREWILQQKHIKCPTDTRFLLQFLRTKKFSQLEARKLLELYLVKKKKLSYIWENLDPTDPEIQQCIDSLTVLPLPGRDKNGRKIVMMRIGITKPEDMKKRKVAIFRTFAILNMFTYLDENTQVHGTMSIMDFTGYSMAHHNAIPFNERKEMSGAFQKAFPARLKGAHLYNAGLLLEFVMSMAKLVMTEKMQKRMKVHSDLESLYKDVPMEMLPEEYLPDDYEGPSAGSPSGIIKNLKEELLKPEMVARIKYLSSSEHTIDESLKPKDEPQASFRKLNID